MEIPRLSPAEPGGESIRLNTIVSAPQQETDMSAIQAPSESALEMYESAKAMLIEFKQSVRLEDLDRAIRLFREALFQRPVSHPMRMYALNNLAMGLVTRFDHQIGRAHV